MALARMPNLIQSQSQKNLAREATAMQDRPDHAAHVAPSRSMTTLSSPSTDLMPGARAYDVPRRRLACSRGTRWRSPKSRKGAPILKFGQIIGFAERRHRAGRHVHVPQLRLCRIRARLRLCRGRQGNECHVLPVEQQAHLPGLSPHQRQGRHAQLHRHPDQRQLLGLGRALHGRSRQPFRPAGRLSQRRRRRRLRPRHRLRHGHQQRRLRHSSSARIWGMAGASQHRRRADRRARLRGLPDRPHEGEVRPQVEGRQSPHG